MIAMSIIGLPYGLLLSVIVGVTNMIPYFGPIMGAIPGVIIYLVIEPKYAIIYVIMILILQQFDGLYLGPKILGDLTGLFLVSQSVVHILEFWECFSVCR